MTDYFYKAFGLIFKSKFFIPYLYVSEPCSEVDVTIELGKCSNAPISKDHYAYDYGEFGLKIEIQEGKRIIVDKSEQLSLNKIYNFLLSSPIAALLHQREFLVLHGNCILTENGAVLFIGDSGAGKSTLAMHFLKEGYPIISDDICAIDLKTKKIYSSYPFIRLCEDIVDQFKINKSTLAMVREDLNKFYYPLKEFECDSFYIHAIFEIKVDEESNFYYIDEIIDRHIMLYQNVYKNSYFELTNLKKIQFENVGKFLTDNNIEFGFCQRAKDSRLSKYNHISYFDQVKTIFKYHLIKPSKAIIK